MLAGNDNANVCRIDRADALSALTRADPISAVIHGYATSFLNDWLTGRLRIQASTVVPHDKPDRTACRASSAKLANSLKRRSVANGCDEKIGWPPGAEKMHRPPGAPSVSSAWGVGGIVEAQLLQQ